MEAVPAQGDDRLVWDIVKTRLPVLRREVAGLLENEAQA
jgi:hypothetical protein